MKKTFFAFLSMLFFAAPCQADVTGNSYVQNLNVLDGYTLAYSINLPGTMSETSLNPSNYTVWNPVYSTAPLKSVAYYLELTNSSTNASDWVLVTMDPGTTFNGDVYSLTIPSTDKTANVAPNQNAVQAIANNVSTWISTSNVLPLKNVSTNAGTDAKGQTVYSLTGKTGTVEFWTSNYGGNTVLPTGTIGGTNSIDWNDSLSNNKALNNGHGSYQIHILDTVDGTIKGQTLLSYSHMGNGGNVTGLGIGNTAETGDNDWTWGKSNSGNATNYNGNSYSVKSLEILVKTANAEETAQYYAPITAKYSAVPELKNMALAYDLNVPNTSNYDNLSEPSKSNIPYTYDASGNLSFLNGSIGRIGYLMELDGKWAYASMDAFTQDVSKTGVPSYGYNGSFYKEGYSGAFDQTVSHLNVASNTDKVTSGSFAEGKIQFWGTNYSAPSGVYDSNDIKSADGTFGSMQVFNTTTSGAVETVLAYNNWGNTNQAADLGIGTNSGGNLDWTHARNAAGYTEKNIKVFIEPSYITNVSEAKDYQLVYAANLGTGKFSGYSYDASSAFTGDVGRVGYYLELQKTGSTDSQWIFVSMDSFTTEVSKIGVPIGSTGVLEDRLVSHMNVASNVEGVLNGSDFTGKIQFWSGSYNDGGKGYGAFDIRTDSDSNGYGSMQIFNASDDFSTLFAYNNFNRGTQPCLGIGNDPNVGTGNIAVDWSFDTNAGQYTVRNLFILAQLADTALNSYETTNIPINQLFGTQKTTSLNEALNKSVEKGTALDANALGIEKVVSGQPLGNQQALASAADGPKFDFTKVGSGNAAPTSAAILNGMIVNGSSAPNSWTGFGMETEGMMTLDLSELRAAAELPGGVDWKFSSMAEISLKDSSAGSGYAIALLSNESEVLGGYVNGQYFDAQQVGESGIWELVNFDLEDIEALSYQNPAALFDFIIPSEADFLTLASTAAIAGTSGHLFWADSTLTSSVPEPATWTLLVLGLFGLGWMRRRAKR